MEIERKYLVKTVPENLDQYEHEEIEQAYLCQDPTLRIRKKGNRYIFTFKSRPKDVTESNVCMAEEIESELSFEAYMHLFEKADGVPIRKTRYRIPFGNYVIELDVFHGSREGLILAEVEFPSVEHSERFDPPEWFGKNVSGDIRYTNSYMATHEVKTTEG